MESGTGQEEINFATALKYVFIHTGYTGALSSMCAMVVSLDRCSTCDLGAVINDGLSEASKEQLKGKTGEEIVDADIAAQMKG